MSQKPIIKGKETNNADGLGGGGAEIWQKEHADVSFYKAYSVIFISFSPTGS